ncbi:hypothetical protein [Amphritea sp.]|uniref:hypothetical protein n=1 Tax=Amphritea sp. TaxID=1872502 RepID=UPI003A952DBB
MTSDKTNKTTGHETPFNDKRSGHDRREYKDRRDEIRFQENRRKNHGRRIEDKDPWKDALEFD